MKQLLKGRMSGLVLVVLGAALVILLGTITVAARPATEQDSASRTITVSGVGSASGTPDTATIQLGVDVQNADPAQALSEANSTIQQVEDALHNNGIDQEAIQTASFSMWSQDNASQQAGSTANQTTYHVQDILRITANINQAGSVVDEAVAAGANSINGISFDLADPTPLVQQARALAVTNAQQRAEDIARMMGITLGGPVSVTETVGNNPGPVQPLMANAATPVNPGQLSVTVHIDVSYAIN
jgi:uncharacterized protein YggE